MSRRDRTALEEVAANEEAALERGDAEDLLEASAEGENGDAFAPAEKLERTEKPASPVTDVYTITPEAGSETAPVEGARLKATRFMNYIPDGMDPPESVSNKPPKPWMNAW